MNTKIVFTRNSPVRTVLVSETTGQELYRIETPCRLVGSVTRVFRCDPASPPVPSLMPRLHWDANEPYEGHDSMERKFLAGAKPDMCGEEGGNEGESGVASAADESPGEGSPLVENEIARLYWKWFASTRIVFEGKIRTRAQFMPLKGKLKGWVGIYFKSQHTPDLDTRGHRTQELRVQPQRRLVPLVTCGFPMPEGESMHTTTSSHHYISALILRNANRSWLSTTQTRL
jgi:hypothetical protein